MEKWRNEFLEECKIKRPTYADMIDFCCDSLVMNNYILSELEKQNFYFDTYCGDFYAYYNNEGEEITREEFDKLEELGKDCEEVCDDIYQYFIISNADADRLSDYTNELVLYCEQLDLYLLCVKHWGTAWGGVSANWKEPEEETKGDFKK